MIKFNRFIILLIAAVLTFSSCKKKDKISNCNLTEANLAGSYKVESIKYKSSPSSQEVDGTSIVLDPCEIDDIITFNPNHTLIHTDEGTQCAPPSDDNGSWSLSGSTLNFDGTLQTIDTFDCNGFIISETDYKIPGDKVTITLKKQ